VARSLLASRRADTPRPANPNDAQTRAEALLGVPLIVILIDLYSH
jgi:hypothetical protein